MISLVNGYQAVLDACVLVPMPVCAVLLQLAQEPALFVPKWSEDILPEVARALRKPSFDLSPAQIERRLGYMRGFVEEAMVTGYVGARKARLSGGNPTVAWSAKRLIVHGTRLYQGD